VMEPMRNEQASVFFLGRRSFRMEIGTMASSTNEMAIPMSASEIPTERIFGLDRSRRSPVFQASLTPAPAARSASTLSNGALIGLCLTTFAFGVLATSTFNRSWPWTQGKRAPAAAPVQQTTVAPPPFMATVQALPPAPSPPASSTESIVATAATSMPALLAPRWRSKRVRAGSAVPARQTAPTTTTVETSAPEPAPVAPAPAKKWVDPFAD
jgi:hypothetical protein